MPAKHKLQLISFDLCPYVERSRIVLEEKKIPYDIRFIDLKNKPDWFLAISPRGKVPVLLVDERPVFESAVINEMLEELYPEKAMFPRDPVTRAQARGWIVFCNDVLMAPSYTYQTTIAEDAQRVAGATLRDGFSKLEAELVKRAPAKFFMDDEFGLVDAAYAPLLTRCIFAVEVLGTNPLAEFPELSAYTERLLQHPSAVAARAENLKPRLLDMLRERRAKTA
ncbi:MAG: glutathione S-transferase family protein [Polyangiaceae bacterium]